MNMAEAREAAMLADAFEAAQRLVADIEAGKGWQDEALTDELGVGVYYNVADGCADGIGPLVVVPKALAREAVVYLAARIEQRLIQLGFDRAELAEIAS